MANPLIDTELVIAQAIHKQERHLCRWGDLPSEEKERYYQMAREHLKRTAVLVPVDNETARMLRADRLWPFIYTVGNYAARMGQAWRVGEGCQIMDAYEALMEDENE